jgi:hypothetical protein
LNQSERFEFIAEQTANNPSSDSLRSFLMQDSQWLADIRHLPTIHPFCIPMIALFGGVLQHVLCLVGDISF